LKKQFSSVRKRQFENQKLENQEEKQMKKLCALFLALTFVAGMVAVAAAEDRLTIPGEFRVRAWYWENNEDFDRDLPGDKLYYFDQRFRVYPRIQIADGIVGRLRFDFSEVQWGRQTTGDGRGWTRSDAGHTTIQVDRAFIQIAKPMWRLMLGEHYTNLGNAIVVTHNNFGGVLRVNTPVVLDFLYYKVSEGGKSGAALSDSVVDGVSYEDSDFFGGQATYKSDVWNAGLLAATINDNSDVDNSPWVFGLFGGYTWGPLALKGELDFLGGDLGSNDQKGTQIWGNGQWNFSPNIYIAGDLWYADSHNAADERQITGITDGGDSFAIADYGPFNTDILPLENIPEFLRANSAITGKDANARTQTIPEFDPSGSSAGAFGGAIKGGWRVIEPVLLTAQYMYITPDSSTNTALNNVQTISLGVDWECMSNTTLAGAYIWTGLDVDSVSTDSSYILVARLQVKW
jgi:hypothetical protein